MAELDKNYLALMGEVLGTQPLVPYVAGNVEIDEVRDTEQALMYLMLDKSASMQGGNLNESVIDGLNEVKNVVNGSKENIQIAITLFGSDIEMRPFKYIEDVDFSYAAIDGRTRLYDAIVESAQNMIYQFENINSENMTKGIFFIFTDGDDNGSKFENHENAIQAIKVLQKMEIEVLFAAFENKELKNLESFCAKCGMEPIVIRDEHQLRRLMKLVSQKSKNLNMGRMDISKEFLG